METIHHPSCPARHEEGECAWYCGPDLEAAPRTADTMLLDIVAHANQAWNDWQDNVERRGGVRGLLSAVQLEAELPGPKAASWGVQA